MANKLSAKKRARQSIQRTVYNRNYKAGLRKARKSVLQSTAKPESLAKLSQTVALIQRTASKGVIHRNKAANLISRLQRAANKAQA